MDEDEMKKEGRELNEDELDNVAGGCISDKICPLCGSKGYLPGFGGYGGVCRSCGPGREDL